MQISINEPHDIKLPLYSIGSRRTAIKQLKTIITHIEELEDNTIQGKTVINVGNELIKVIKGWNYSYCNYPIRVSIFELSELAACLICYFNRKSSIGNALAFEVTSLIRYS